MSQIRNFKGDKSKLKNIEDRKKESKKKKEEAKESGSSLTIQEQLKLALKARRGFIDGSKLDKESTPSDKADPTKELPSLQANSSSSSKLPELGTSNNPFDNISKMIPPPTSNNNEDDNSDGSDWE